MKPIRKAKTWASLREVGCLLVCVTALCASPMERTARADTALINLGSGTTVGDVAALIAERDGVGIVVGNGAAKIGVRDDLKIEGLSTGAALAKVAMETGLMSFKWDGNTYILCTEAENEMLLHPK
jgi:hypothetical protein